MFRPFQPHLIIPRKEIPEKQRQSQLLLLLDWNDPGYGGCPGKLYEYLAARRPIISTGGCNGAVKNILEETNAGFYCQTETEIKTVLLQSYREFKEEAGSVSYQGKEEAIMRYSHRVMAKKFAEILNIPEWAPKGFFWYLFRLTYTHNNKLINLF